MTLEHCALVSEIGHNHGGNPQRALEMIRVAAACGVDAVKLQRRHNKRLYTRDAYATPYANENSFGRTYGEHREALELPLPTLIACKNVAHEVAFDPWSVDDLADIQVDFLKVASGDLTNLPLIAHAAATGLPLVVSTGGGTWAAVQAACRAAADATSLTVLQCTASYPARYEDLHLAVIPQMISDFAADGWLGVRVGASLHVSGIAMGLAAYMLGASMIEMHFTLDRASKGTDHAFSLEPQGLRKLVRDIRRAQVAYGQPYKVPLACETEPIRKMSKGCVFARALPVGHVVTVDDIAFKSPGNGYPPSAAHTLTGRVLACSVMMDDPVSEEVLMSLRESAHVRG